MCVEAVVCWTHQLMELFCKQFIWLVLDTLHYQSLDTLKWHIFMPFRIFSGGCICERHTVVCMGSGIAMQHDTPMSMPEYFLMMVVQKSQRVTWLCCVLMMSWTLHTKAINSGHNNGSRSSPGISLWQDPTGWCTSGKSAIKAVRTVLMACNYLCMGRVT
jgi:hypothetical protein